MQYSGSKMANMHVFTNTALSGHCNIRHQCGELLFLTTIEHTHNIYAGYYCISYCINHGHNPAENAQAQVPGVS